MREAFDALKHKCGASPRPLRTSRSSPSSRSTTAGRSHTAAQAPHSRSYSAAAGKGGAVWVSEVYRRAVAVQLLRSARLGKSGLRVLHVFSETGSVRVARMFEAAAAAMGPELVQWVAVDLEVVRRDALSFNRLGISANIPTIFLLREGEMLARLDELHVRSAGALSSWVGESTPDDSVKVVHSAHEFERMSSGDGVRKLHGLMLLVSAKPKLSLLFKAVALKYKGSVIFGAARYPQCQWLQARYLIP